LDPFAFIWQWRAYVLDESSLDSARAFEILSGRSETQITVGATAYLFGIVIVLTIVMPKAYLADFILSSPVKSEKTAAGAPVGF